MTRFRALPLWVKVVGWIVLWPLLGALVILSGDRPSRLRYAAAAAVLVLGVVVYVPKGDDAAERDRVVAAHAAEADAQAADEAAAAAEAEQAAAAEEASRRAEERAARRAEERAAARAAAEEEATRLAAEEEAAEVAAAEAARAAEARATWTVFNVVDGDTIDVRHADGTEERIRIIGIDTPERGECNFGPASSAMRALVDGEEVVLTDGARDDRDRYGRLIRYVDVHGVDAGLKLIEEGLAIARYDSRDGYGAHPREAAYVAADAATPQVACATPPPTPAPAPAASPYPNCAAARAAGAAPVRRGDSGYGPHLDRDNDGIGCE